jgi:hypothetical protein
VAMVYFLQSRVCGHGRPSYTHTAGMPARLKDGTAQRSSWPEVQAFAVGALLFPVPGRLVLIFLILSQVDRSSGPRYKSASVWDCSQRGCPGEADHVLFKVWNSS